jgi:hypothetical protein
MGRMVAVLVQPCMACGVLAVSVHSLEAEDLLESNREKEPA